MTPATALVRHADWPQRLADYVASRSATPFAWVGNDCCTFAAGAVLAMTGQDLMAPHRTKYKTQRSAARVLAQAGGLRGWVTSTLGEPLAAPALAQRGDVVLYDMHAPHGPGLGVCVGASFAAPGPNGGVLLPMAAVSAAWRI